MDSLDPRCHAFRPDLADIELAEKVTAERYVAGAACRVARGSLDLRVAPDASARLGSQLLFGEAVTCYERLGGWAWVRNRRDGYVGYVAAAGLAEPGPAPTHQVSALRTLLLAEPDLKAPTVDLLSLTSPVAVVGERGLYCEIAGGGWIHHEHLAPLDAPEPDYVATAQLFLAAPYLWGGRGSLGLDCSALVQLALARAGIDCPRDSDQQERALGGAAPRSPDASRPRRGDLLFSPGHVAIALDAERVLHATAHGLRVRVEPLADLAARVATDGGFTGTRRPLG